ncbi:carboxypeptidase regulatory-like domain-containing protein [Plectonema radiosum NIES-515]|uniref:Carboxypeptidase regulatory-like domain-containing protein n=1 Tax=Plectonema radiosum NIES-515 TaxID=2986073 RepID=A0ABT3AU15_9CYAN|nr:carboxypeptidase regulatory-like domain-containing protein [Plectonema radiosum]MCV3212599.1 carboxypeptidase regulatory-like domain-containing protein [Plectonema radiosum NIES-515]
MLYLALPPTPPPIFITLRPEQVANKSDIEQTFAVQATKSYLQNSTAKVQKQVCKSPQNQPQKSDLVNNLLGKMLAASNQATEAVVCTKSQNKKSVVLNFQAQNQKQKQAKGFLAVASQTTENTSTAPALSSPENSSATPNIATVYEEVTASKNLNPQNTTTSTNTNTNSGEQPEYQKLISSLSNKKFAEKNTIGKILSAVQELISVSLYASLNNTTHDALKSDNQHSEEIAIATPEQTTDNKKPEDNSTNSLTQEIATNTNAQTGKILAIVQELISVSISASLNNQLKPDTKTSEEIASSIPQQTSNSLTSNNNKKPENNIGNAPNQEKVAANNNVTNNDSKNTLIEKLTGKGSIQLAKSPDEPFLVGVIINGREVGTLDIIQEGNTLLIPLESFGEVAGFKVENTDTATQVKTPLGVVKLQPNSLKQINGITYIIKSALKDELSINVDLNTADLTLLTDLPWRGNIGQYRPRAADLKPEFFAPSSGLSNFRQELNIDTNGGDTSLRSSSLLGGRLGGWAYRLRLDNNFVDQPDVSEYFLYKHSGRFLYQLGRQQVGLHPLLNGIDLTGLQFGYSNLPEESFGNSYSANELLSRRSRPIQTFRGKVEPASFVQLRVGGTVVAQQQVGFNGLYEFVDVNLPVGQSNEIEVVIFDRNNLRVPREIRTVRINASDLLLPAGGNVQLGGLGFSGNLVQNGLFGDVNYDNQGKPVGFYQLRQGLSSNLTFESSLQAVPNALQSQAGLIWRLANPVVLSASVGSSANKLGYSADLDVQLNRLEINANSQSLPEGYRLFRNSTQLFNHSLELKYRFGNTLNLGFLARNRKDDSGSASYILPTFSARPFSTLSLNGRPDFDGRYLFNAFYQPNRLTRLSFNTYGDAYISDLTYNLSDTYQLSFGNEFGGNLAPRYSIGIGHNPSDLRALSWNLGVSYRDGEIGPLAGASMQVLPGLFARVEYQGIPSRTRGNFGGFGDDRLSLSLVSDLSFAGGRVAPANYSGIGKDRGAIAGRLVVQGENKKFDLSGSNIRVYDKRNQSVGSARTDSSGNFFVGNLPEGNYIVELEPDELPVELSVPKTSTVVQVATSAVTKLDFPLRPEYGVAGRITDVAGQPIERVRIELINSVGVRALSAMTDQFGLYRLDGVPVGKYTLRVSPQDSLNPNDTLPKQQIEIKSEFVYNQNLQLPISAAAKKK